VVRTLNECLQAVLWDGATGLAPLTHRLPGGLACVPVADAPPTRLVLAWNTASTGPLIRSFTRIAAASYRRAAAS
jgi:hypothetical protein